MRQGYVWGVLSLLSVAACGDSRVFAPAIEPRSGIEALSGCYDPVDPQCSHTPPSGDPAPLDSGAYLGPDFTPAVCSGVYTNDSDDDGFDDFCEFHLALAFRPLLSADPNDENLTRQSYWAAQWNGTSIDIIYMLGYYFDNGNQHAAACAGSLHIFCYGHFGDSEFIIARVAYDAGSMHWKLWNATLSAHYGSDESGLCPWLPFTNCDYTRHKGASTFEYPTKRLHYPRVYVALNKHANYHSRGACNDGGPYDSDDCTYAQDFARVDVNRYRNVGNNFHPRISSATSSVDPVVYSGIEFYWNNEVYHRFCGWDGASAVTGRQNCAPTGYEEILFDFGFGIGII